MRFSTYQRILRSRSASTRWLHFERLGDAGEHHQVFRGLLSLIRDGYNDSGAYTNLAYAFDEGIGTKPSRRMAIHWYRKAWRRNCASAATNLAILLETENRLSTAELWYQRAIKQRDGYARLRLAKLWLREGKNFEAMKHLLEQVVTDGPQCVVSLKPDGTTEPADDEEFLEAQQLLKEIA